MKLILFCVTSTKLSLLWNDRKLDPIIPQRGLRQGNPLSPYIFDLCMEHLNHLIKKEVDNEQWKTVKASYRRLAVSHIFFADKHLLFGEASLKQAKVMAVVLESFCLDNGQKVYTNKSLLFVSKNTDSVVRDELSQTFLYLGQRT